MKLFISVNAAASSTSSLGPSWVRTQNAPDVNVPPAHYTSDETASHATITNEKLKNERVLFSAAAAFLGYDRSFGRLERSCGRCNKNGTHTEGFRGLLVTLIHNKIAQRLFMYLS